MQNIKALLMTVFLLSTYSYSPASTPEGPVIKDGSPPIHTNDLPVALNHKNESHGAIAHETTMIDDRSPCNHKNGPHGALTRKIDSLVALQLDAGQPGGVIGILSAGQVLVKKSYGSMDHEQNRENDVNTIFDIASVAKQFTAFAILLLEKEGKLNLDDNVHTWLPELPVYEHDITIRHLLQHTSGIASTDVLRLFAGLSLDEPWSQKDELEMIQRYPQLNFKPNTKHVYSNAGYSLLARVVESATGMKFSQFMKEKVFDPLQMSTAFVYDDPLRKMHDVASGYKIEDGDVVKVSSIGDYSYGSGNIFASLDDMIGWGRSLFSAKAESRDYFNRITNRYNTLESGDTINYTYGFYVRDHKGVRMVEHSGGVPGFRNQFMIFPDDDLIVILMFNNESIRTRGLAVSIAELLLGDRLVQEAPRERVAVDLDPVLFRSYEGSYQMDDGMELSFSFEQDTFWLILPGDARFQLYAESETEFFLKAFDAQCTFVTSGDGAVNEMIWHQGGGDYSAARVEERETLSADELAMYAGQYVQKALNAEYPVTFEDGRLIMHTPGTFKKYLGFDSLELSHINGDRFLTDRMGMLEFTRDTDGLINGFVLADVGRLQNITFSKQ
jgi:CubicO group peptidase (beta-lactamase class C family)